ncbi:MAG TPA: POTRA domain-containing protein, partial [Rhodothermales bacterium]
MRRRYSSCRWMLAGLIFGAGIFRVAAAEPVNPPDYEPSLPESPIPAGTPKLEFHVEFRGVEAREEPVLREELAEQLGGIRDYGLNAARANDAAFFLSLYFLKHGYAHVQVRERIVGNTLILDVAKGPLVTLGKIVFEGNDSIDDETLNSYLIGATRERFSRFRSEIGLPFIEADIKTGASRIRGLYLSEGFVHVDVSKPLIVYSPDRKVASVTLKIVEGIRYTVGAPVITGQLPELPEEEQASIGKTMAEYAGKAYTPQRIVNMQRTLGFEYKKRGYFKATVAYRADLAEARDGVVPVSLAVEAGGLYTFDGVEFHVEDGARLKRSFLENRFRGLSGQV